jgi:hypothetical protein
LYIQNSFISNKLLNSLQIPKAKNAAETLQIARERGSEQDSAITNNKPVHKKLQPAVERLYSIGMAKH